MGLNNPKLPSGAARGAYQKKRGGAMYGMQPTIYTAMTGRGKVLKIAPPVWNYQPGRVTLVKLASR